MRVTLTALLLLTLFLIGCKTVPAETTKEPVEIMLELNELPKDWKIEYQRVTTESDRYNVPVISLEDGWQKGYGAVYTDPTETYDLTQFVDYYPLESISKIFIGRYGEQQQLPDPKIGQISRAYKKVDDFFGTTYEIEFIKKNVHILLTMEGENNYELLNDLARKVERKI